jgi:thiol-disulfide isomerase/thioredoxin
MAAISRRTVLSAPLFAGWISRMAAGENPERAPNFWAKTLDGERYTNASVQGKVVLVQFWTTWCPNCRRDEPAVESINEEFKDKGLVVLSVDVGEAKKKVMKYLADSPRSCKMVLMEDTNLAAMFAANAFPVYVLIDRDGNIAGRQNGAGGEDMLRRLLAKAGIAAE